MAKHPQIYLHFTPLFPKNAFILTKSGKYKFPLFSHIYATSPQKAPIINATKSNDIILWFLQRHTAQIYRLHVQIKNITIDHFLLQSTNKRTTNTLYTRTFSRTLYNIKYPIFRTLDKSKLSIFYHTWLISNYSGAIPLHFSYTQLTKRSDHLSTHLIKSVLHWACYTRLTPQLLYLLNRQNKNT